MKNSKKIIRNIKKQQSKGLGDTIEKVTTATGIKKATKVVFDKLGYDCGCDKRKEALNKLFPYKTPECLTEKEYQQLDVFVNRERKIITSDDQKTLLTIHNRIFPRRRELTGCGSCVRELANIMEKVYHEYK